MYVKQQARLSLAPAHPRTPTSHSLGCASQSLLESPAGWKMLLDHSILRQGQVVGLGPPLRSQCCFTSAGCSFYYGIAAVKGPAGISLCHSCTYNVKEAHRHKQKLPVRIQDNFPTLSKGRGSHSSLKLNPGAPVSTTAMEGTYMGKTDRHE